MRHLRLTITARSPLAIRADHAEGGSATARSIPGTTLLGSLAAAHRILRPNQEQEFTRLFQEERVLYPHLYPALFSQSSAGLHAGQLPVQPLPKTAQSCKRFRGFQPLPAEETHEKRHGIRDSLLDWAVFSLLDSGHTLLVDDQQPISTLLAPLERHDHCSYPGCHQPLDRIDGYYRSASSDPHQRMQPKNNRHLQTRTGINRDWGVVEEGILYSREVFDDGMQFWGEILFPDEEELPARQRLIWSLQTLLEEAKLWETPSDQREKVGLLRLGTGRSRGLGCIDTRATEAHRADKAAFKKRLAQFDDMLRTRARAFKAATPHAFYFAVTLNSATILRDAFLRYQQSLDAATLASLLDQPPATFMRIYQATGIQQVTGWNELWGTPRPGDYALEMGSTFLFASKRAPDDDQSKLLDALYTLEETGIGERCSEGFGRVSISDAFHLEGEQW
jgi:CRISPR-associated protein Csx10